MSWSLGEVGDRETRLLHRDLLKFHMETGCRRYGGFGLGSLDPSYL